MMGSGMNRERTQPEPDADQADPPEQDDPLDHALAGTFPASDPVSAETPER